MPINIKRSLRIILVSTIVTIINGGSSPVGFPDDIKSGIQTIVIDAGHGGNDSGAVGKKGIEKDIALSIALKFGKYVEDNLKDVKVIYTRKTDTYIELFKRAEIANEAEADLFISIHVNAHTQASAFGTLTLVLGQHREDENFDVAVRENSVILLEDDYETIYQGFDPTSSESYIMFKLMQKTFFKQSIEFGSFVQNQFKERANRTDRGVHEQGLLVLAQTSMPGVLIETGFLSNPTEEKFLITEDGQEILASAIFRGFREYKEEIDRRSTFSTFVDEQSAEETPGDLSATTPSAPPADKIIFRIQIASARSKIDTNPSSFKGYTDVSILEDGRWFKYMVDGGPAYKDALSRCLLIKDEYPDAFVVAIKNGKLIPMNEAIQEINR